MTPAALRLEIEQLVRDRVRPFVEDLVDRELGVVRPVRPPRPAVTKRRRRGARVPGPTPAHAASATTARVPRRSLLTKNDGAKQEAAPRARRRGPQRAAQPSPAQPSPAQPSPPEASVTDATHEAPAPTPGTHEAPPRPPEPAESAPPRVYRPVVVEPEPLILDHPEDQQGPAYETPPANGEYRGSLPVRHLGKGVDGEFLQLEIQSRLVPGEIWKRGAQTVRIEKVTRGAVTFRETSHGSARRQMPRGLFLKGARPER